MKKRVLHIIPSVGTGGIESLILSLCKAIDRNKIQIDLAALNPNDQTKKEQFEKIGVNVYFISNAGCKSTFIFKILWRIKGILNFKKLIKKNKYDVVHCHNSNSFTFYVLLAKYYKIHTRIVHSHIAGDLKKKHFFTYLKRLRNIICFENLITHKIGCSDVATKWAFGENNFKKGRAFTIYNGINTHEFKFIRKKKQEKEISFIHIGRFATEKNQIFLINIFKEILSINSKCTLTIVGSGDKSDIQKKVNSLNISKNVFFKKSDSDIKKLLSESDYFLLPSISEGLGIAAIESQISGTPIFISENVTREVDIGLAVYLPLEKGYKYWAETICFMITHEKVPTELNNEKVKTFSIEETSKQFTKIYMS